MELGEYDKAADAYSQWLKAEPQSKDAKAGLEKAQQASEAVKPATDAAEKWLKLVDAGKYGGSWDAAAAYFRKAVTKDAWTKQVTAARKPLGKMLSRKFKSALYTTSLPGAGRAIRGDPVRDVLRAQEGRGRDGHADEGQGRHVAGVGVFRQVSRRHGHT